MSLTDEHPAALRSLVLAGWQRVAPGYWSIEVPAGGEVAIELLIFGDYMLAVYDKHRELISETKLTIAVSHE